MSSEPRKRAAWGIGRTAFVALSQEIFAELDREMPKTVVYRKFESRLGISYSQFNRLVTKYRTRQSHQGHPSALQSTPIRRERKEPVMVGDEPLKTFHYDPLDAYRKKFD